MRRSARAAVSWWQSIMKPATSIERSLSIGKPAGQRRRPGSLADQSKCTVYAGRW
jgi:hypothetical protein